MKRSRIIALSIAAIVIVVAVWWFFLREKEPPVTLETEQPTWGYIAESVTATGTIQPVDTTSVGSQITATIEELHADFNSTVKKGQLLAVLDRTLLQATVDQFKASLAEARSNALFQESNFNRQQQLYETGAISKAEYELAQNSFRMAQAVVKNVQAQLRSAERNLSFTRIYSPVDGVVLNRAVSVGQTVTSNLNTPTLFVIARDITKMQVQADVDEADIGDVAEKQRTTFTVDAYLNEVFEGIVKEIRLQPTVVSNVVTYTTIIDAPNDNKKLKPGMTANIVIYTKEADSTLLIPAKAIQFRPDSTQLKDYTLVGAKQEKKKTGQRTGQPDSTAHEMAYVWVLRDKQLVETKIRMGLNDNTHIEVREGLGPDDVVVTGLQSGSGEQAAGGTSTSPFMPPRRGGRR
ncbi:efflux RND transporter periplasmic adaptor subunit [Rhabdobacter roseus]|uniref:HlyD family secretion protein n=1 Tax=Rhabdobacter roseus TaxID=1655419 RepID=A0A840TL58_9BACT|nr:efflux RND transporter periplasmic adaptor subunit [Rhabdobacter roseus]MBB5282527.1 HlyD family secretion protein [Rhabdobacter roseus]